MIMGGKVHYWYDTNQIPTTIPSKCLNSAPALIFIQAASASAGTSFSSASAARHPAGPWLVLKTWNMASDAKLEQEKWDWKPDEYVLLLVYTEV